MSADEKGLELRENRVVQDNGSLQVKSLLAEFMSKAAVAYRLELVIKSQGLLEKGLEVELRAAWFGCDEIAERICERTPATMDDVAAKAMLFLWLHDDLTPAAEKERTRLAVDVTQFIVQASDLNI